MNHRNFRKITPAAIAVLALSIALPTPGLLAQAGSGQSAPRVLVAYDLVNSTNLNLNSYVNGAPSFTSPADCFSIFQRGVSSSIPFDVTDDSAGSFPADDQGIIQTGNAEEFFCIGDTENADNSGAVSASWAFDVNGVTDLEVKLNIGAMGDFESTDSYVIEATLDGGSPVTLFSLITDDAISQNYTMEGGAVVNLNDPVKLGGVLVNNILQTFSALVAGTGSELVITVTALTNGGGEAVALQNLEILGFPAAPANPVINEFLQNPSAVSDSNGEWFELYNPGGVAIDIDGWTIKDDGSDSHVINNGGPLMLPAGGYLVLGRNGDTGTNGGVTVDYVYGTWFLSNGADEIILLDGSLVEMDRVEYDGGPNFPDANGASASLIDPALDNNVGANWCEATTPFGDGDLGTPGSVNDCASGSGPELLLSELVVTPTAGEFIEIHNPGASPIDLSDVYLTDATFANGGAYYYNIVTGADAGGGGFGDFLARFPDGASIAAGAYQTVSLPGSDDFFAEFGINPDYELFEDGGSADAIPDMREGLPDSINGQGGLTNSGEVVILFFWDGLTDLVGDLDYAVWGDKAEAVDKTGVTMFGSSDYLADTAIASQDVIAGSGHASGTSWQREDLTEGTETTTGGNGANGNDETSENLSATWCEAAPTPGEATDCTPPAVEVFIHEVQGDGLASPMVGAIVAIEGIVVGDFQDGTAGTHGDLNGFHVQEEDDDADADPLTSEGIFVFDGNSPAVDVQVGDLVRVEGTVAEFFNLTELTNVTLVSVISSGNTPPTPASVTLPVATGVDDFEPFEGMAISFPQTLVISEYFNFDRFNETILTSTRHLAPTAEFEPGSTDASESEQNYQLDRITLDDGRATQYSDPAIHPDGNEFDLDNLFRGGDTLDVVTGVMDYSFGLYRIQPTQGAVHTDTNARTPAPDAVGGSLKVAAYNVLNYFTTIDDSGSICGPNGDQGCRGADTDEEFTRQRDKIIAALAVIDADVVGLVELENHPADEPTADLVSGLNDMLGAGTYDYVVTGAIGDDVIRQAFIYKPATATPDGAFAILDSSVDPTFNDERNRPTLAQTFRDNATTGRVTVAVNHFKSKGSNCNAQGDPDSGDGSGNCNGIRTEAATALANWLATDPTASGDDDYLVIGDLNSYDNETPIDALEGAGYTDLADSFIGNAAYSFVFNGRMGYLDYAMAGAALFGEVTGATIWNTNADESDLLDYNLDNKKPAQAAIYAKDSYRASDHDPILVGLDLVPVADLSITKAASIEPAVAGGMLTYTVTVSNAGPDDAFDVVVTDNLPAGTSLVSTSGCTEDPTGAPTCTLGRVNAGDDAEYTIVIAVDAGLGNGTVLSNSASVVTSSFDPESANNTTASPTLTTVVTEAYWDVTKNWNRGGNGSVTVTLTCDGIDPVSGVVNPGTPTTLTATGWVNGTTSCVVTEDVPGGTFEQYSVDCEVDDVVSNTAYICEIGNSEAFATFAVRKRFMDGNDVTPVTFHMDCNNGLPTEQQLTVIPDTGDFSRGDYEVNFVVTKFAPGEMDCTVYEEPIGGYTASYVCGSVNNPDQVCTDGDNSLLDNFGDGPCHFEDVDSSGAYDSINYCTIRNYPNPGAVSITKEWVIQGAGGNALNPEARIEIVSSGEVTGSYECQGNQWCTSVNFYGPGAQTNTLAVATTFEGTVIHLDEDVYDNTFLSENDCNNTVTVYPTGYAGNDGTESCTFTNTAFFEGIPTLNQYGMAILVLLMMGVGMVGFRRYS